MSRPPSEERKRRDPADDPEDPALLVDTVIDGRYHLTSLVGRGGMGAVFLAEHVTIRRPVALKLLQPSLAAIPELARRFEREAFAIGRIDHPNCVSVMDFGRLGDGSLYLVMEYLDGRSLGDAIEAEGRIPARRALHILRHVLRGLGHAHHAGIVHRDVKPENVILVEHEGVPEFAKILDFGIARFLRDTPPDAAEGEERLTQAGIAFGTPAYMSPEQAVGDPVDPRADLYAATVMLFEMIAGRPPFHSADKLELLGMHAMKQPPRLSEVRPDALIPASLDELVAIGMAKKPAERFADADEYIAAIEDVLRERLDGDFASPVPTDDTEPVPIAAGAPGSGRTTAPPGGRPSTALRLRAPSTTGRVAPGRRGPVRGRGRARKVALTTALVLVAAGAGYGGYFLLGPSDDVDLLAGLKSETAVEAERTLTQGDPGEAIELLKERAAAVAGDAQAQLQLAHAHAARLEYRPALEAYAAALELDPSLIGEERVQANLRLMFDDDGAVYLEAARLLATLGRDEAARARIAELASSADRSVRKKAFALAEELDVGDRIDRLTAFVHDLRQDPTCKARREAVIRLRALGDPRAIAPLEKALVRRGKRRGRKRRRNENACLRQHAEDAIRFLKAQPAAAGGAAQNE
ncbi:MAG TPA: protein kinase [Kofleriaceae bacterium]|nr:protein kinase [Kofleriaceae bacterium]